MKGNVLVTIRKCTMEFARRTLTSGADKTIEVRRARIDSLDSEVALKREEEKCVRCTRKTGTCDQLIISQQKKAATEKFESPAKNVSRTRDT